MSKGTAITIEMMNASEINDVKIGGKVISKNVSEGNQKTDKDGNPLFNENDGQPICWADSYYVEFAFQGGVTKFKVSQEVYQNVEDGMRYQFIGRAFMKTPYGDGKPYLSIEPIRFDFLF